MIRAAFLMMLAGPVLAHTAPTGWTYPYECCSSVDCEPMEARSMSRTDAGWLLPNGEVVPFDQARDSGDHMFHWCRVIGTATIIRPTGKAPCFFAPPGGG